jgi:hypothetical protein
MRSGSLLWVLGGQPILPLCRSHRAYVCESGKRSTTKQTKHEKPTVCRGLRSVSLRVRTSRESASAAVRRGQLLATQLPNKRIERLVRSWED